MFPHGSTGDGHPLALAAASAVLEEFADGRILENVRARSAQLTAALRALPQIHSVHGPGLMIAVGLAAPDMLAVKHQCRDAGLLVSISNNHIILTPSLVLTAAEADILVSRLDHALRAALGEIAEATGHHQDATAHRERARQLVDEIGSSGRQRRHLGRAPDRRRRRSGASNPRRYSTSSNSIAMMTSMTPHHSA